MSTYDYDLFVIGAGSGGVRAARIAAGYGKRIAIAEKSEFGGTCVNVGCVPKKIMTYVASYASAMKDAEGYGWSIGERTLDWASFIARKNDEIDRLNRIYENMLRNSGVTIYQGHARIQSPHSVLINGKTVIAERILIATGGKTDIPNFAGAEHGCTSDDMFYLKALPSNITIYGSGFIALEFAGIFKALGANVNLIFRRDHILNEGFDFDVRLFLEGELVKKGITLLPATQIEEIKSANNSYIISTNTKKSIPSDLVLLATGRAPNTDNLGLKELGIASDSKGAIMVNSEHQTNIPSIYAVGDVTNRVNLTPVALSEGHCLVDRLYGNKARYTSYENIPSAVFSDPPLSQVGLTEDEAAKRFPNDINIYKTDFRPMKNILANKDERTLMKLVVQRSTDKVLGLHMAGTDAPEIVQGFATAIIAGATKSDFDRTIGIHPTAAEEFVTLRSLHKSL